MPKLPSHQSADGCRMGLVMVIINILTSIASIWAVVSFLLYLFKDIPFNWWSIGLTLFGMVIMGLLFIWMLANDNY